MRQRSQVKATTWQKRAPTTISQALAHAVLYGEPVFPENVVTEGVQ